MVFCLVTTSIAQKTITGRIVGKDGLPIEGASIKIQGKTLGTATNAKGEFKISANAGDEILITAINFNPEKFKVGNKLYYETVLTASISLMEEIVVTAAGIKTKRKEQGYAATTIKADELTMAKPTNIASGLSGKVAGLEVSGTGGGVNPNYRLILRGQRSLLGNNQALIVLDNVIVPNAVLGNLNPEDVADITVLNGAGAVALYGSDASNGALIVTTKRGRKGTNIVKIANTTTLEQVAFFPKHQTKFGQGGSGYGTDGNGNPIYSPRENQSYGPAFDGSTRQLGDFLEDGSAFYTTYAAKDDWKKFWETGVTNQTDFSIASGDDVSTLFFSGQYVTTKGTTPNDKYNRIALRLNGTRKILSDKITASYALNYVQNRYDVVTSSTFATMYDNLNNIAANVPITQFKDWRTNKFANPNGYFNPWYANPYFSIDNNRNKTRNDYLVGSLDLKYAPLKWIDFTWRTGLTTQNNSSKYSTDKFNYTTYALYTNASIGGTKSNIPGSVEDYSGYSTQLTSDLLIGLNKKTNDFTFNGIVAGGVRQNISKGVDGYVSGLVIPGLFNLSNTSNNPSVTSTDVTSRRMAVYGEIKIGYKNYLFLHATGRNDWVSVLNPNNWSFFYPAVDASFIATDAIGALRNIKWLDYLKVRGGISKVGNVNIGAYSLQTTYGQYNGYPYSGAAGYTVGNRLIYPNIVPEFTQGGEVGIDFSLKKGLIDGSITWYSTNTTNQTVPVSISWTTGSSSYLMNTGETKNTGLETRLAVTPIKTKDWTVTVGGNYTYSDNKVVSINSLLPSLAISTYSNAGSYAVPGMVFPVIMGNDYARDPKGRVIVDAKTGRPQVDNAVRVLGNAATKDRLSLDLNVRWKQFRFYALFEYRGGNKIYNVLGTSLDWSGVGLRTAAYDRKAFVFPNSVYADPAHPGTYIDNKTVVVNNANDGFWADNDGTYNRGIASNYVTDGAFWKLRQASISYDLPASLVHKMKAFKAITISAQGRNLFLWLPKSNLYTDPEYSDAGNDSNGIGLTGMSSAPPSRFYGATLSFTF